MSGITAYDIRYRNGMGRSSPDRYERTRFPLQPPRAWDSISWLPARGAGALCDTSYTVAPADPEESRSLAAEKRTRIIPGSGGNCTVFHFGRPTDYT